VWDGAFDADPSGACSAAFDIFTTSRIEAGGPVSGDVYKCRTMPVVTAIDEGLYGEWTPDADEQARLESIFPEGVCDYELAGVGDPRVDVPGLITDVEVRGASVHVAGAEPRAEVQLRADGEVVATARANPQGRATIARLAAGTYVITQVVDGQRGLLSEPTELITVRPPASDRRGGPPAERGRGR